MARTPINPSVSKYEIAKPESYDAFPLAQPKPAATVPATPSPAEVSEKVSAPPQAAVPPAKTAAEDWSDAEKARPQIFPSAKNLFEPPDEPTEKSIRAESVVREKRAVWIVHGMGQQIPFETLDGLTNGLRDALADQTNRALRIQRKFRTAVKSRERRKLQDASLARLRQSAGAQSMFGPAT